MTEIDNDEVRWSRTLTIRVLRETPEVHTSGWREGAVAYMDVEQDEDEEHLLIRLHGQRYRLSRAAIEAIYDLHQGVPR